MTYSLKLAWCSVGNIEDSLSIAACRMGCCGNQER